ncbi:unnamed protein product (macronuclear) [Paramecium tetraurelia]|uniref:mitogen-activated protein kinase kinase n=1 Tax=Paramecium tetraurelia TaxID=5888 RepID=A0BG00_PARTE|nr:uncharacterized protein GSPATT00028502001 [Paramecium tetraurelia]CAK57467.1 unnamed protein product [Paramecium tetraurelia]|eukprot:XP_001424865.1 hypothetical protein (macronuclear) [Paramecium tetraurelia strain d4-2]
MKNQKRIHEELSLSISTLVQSQIRIEDMITTGTLRSYADSSPVKKMLHAPTMKLYVVKEVHLLFNSKEPLHNKEIRKNLKDWISFWQSKCSNSIQHVQIYSTFWSTPEGYVSIVMEYMNGGSLQNLLESMGVLPERSIKQLVQPILYGLQRIHQSGAQCHGALGPSQILFLRDGTVKLSQGLQYRAQIQGNSAFNQYILGRAKDSQSLYDPSILETPSLWSKAPSEKYHFPIQDDFILERANDIWKLGWLILNCAIGTMEFHPKAQQIYEGSRIILEEITKYVDQLKDTCCLLHSELKVIQFVEQNSKIFNEPTRITILDLLPPDKFSAEFIQFLCSTLKIDPRQRLFTEQLLQHSWLTGGKECKGPNVQLKELISISNAWNTFLPEEFQGQGAQKLERLCDALCLVLQNSEKPTVNKMHLQENSPIIKELSHDMGINAKVISERLISIFQSLI